jgi:hydroxymethylbilane synthase
MTTPRRELVVGTRGSALAIAQTNIVSEALRRLHPSVSIRIERIVTTGDARADVPLSQLGRGVFVSEIESALRNGRIDFAVHSAKDLPSTLASDLTLAAFLPRADARDVLVSRVGVLRDLPAGARVGTSSPRRMCQLRALRPDLDLRDMRGNVDTRLRKLAAGEYDAIVLAAAGLIRLGRAEEATEWLDRETMIPCVGQGALAVEARADDAFVASLLEGLDDADTRAAVTAERAFLAELGAGCRAAAGAHARIDGDGRLRISAMIGATDGRHMMGTLIGEARDAEHAGSAVARQMLRDGAAVFVATAGGALANKHVAITRAAEQSAELIALLRARGAQPVSCPTIAIEAITDTTELDAALAQNGSTRWMVFTSGNAVRAVADRLAELRLELPATLLLAAVGGATAQELRRCIREPDFVASVATGAILAAQLPDVSAQDVIVPRGDLAAEAVADGLRARGARVRSLVAYRTVSGPGVAELGARAQSGQLDAVVFASPSSIRFAATALANARMLAPRFPAIVCIGPTTAQAARALGFDPDAVAMSQSTGGIVEALELCLAGRPRHDVLTAT